MGCSCNKSQRKVPILPLNLLQKDKEENPFLLTDYSREEKQNKQNYNDLNDLQNDEEVQGYLKCLGSDSIEQINHFGNKLFKSLTVQKGNQDLKVNLQILESHANIFDSYEIKQLIGRGIRSSIRTVLHKLTNEIRTVKIIRKKSISDVNAFLRELTALFHISHPNILHFYEFFQDEKQYYLVFEYCKGGDLLEKILMTQSISENNAAIIMSQIFSVVKFLHNRNLLHKALRCESVLIKSQLSISEIKVSDISTAFRDYHYSQIQENPQYTAPEVLRLKKFSEKSDVWSCGTILYTMLFGYLPFEGKQNECIQKILSGKLNFPVQQQQEISQQAVSLIKKMLKINPSDRLSIDQCLNSKWMQLFFKSQKKNQSNNSSQEEIKEKAKEAILNMQSFGKKRDIQKGTINYISSLFSTSDQRKELEQQFIKLDLNKDGKLSFEEMKQGFQVAFGKKINEEQIRQIFKAVDTDQSGFIDFSEFIAAAVDANQILTMEKLEKLFKSIDKDNSGSISIHELRQILQSIKRGSEVFINQLINHLAENSQDEIDYQEFIQVITNQIIKRGKGKKYSIIANIFKNRNKSIKHTQESILPFLNLQNNSKILEENWVSNEQQNDQHNQEILSPQDQHLNKQESDIQALDVRKKIVDKEKIEKQNIKRLQQQIQFSSLV